MGQLKQGDCLEVLASYPDKLVDLVYLDPPFFTQKKHSLSTRDFSKTYTFSDEWASLDDYLNFLRQRLIEIKRLMQDHANLFFHCDKSASHHIRLLLDQIFGANNFRSEIIWTYKRWSSQKRTLLNTHQTIFMYSKTEQYIFNQLFEDYSTTTNLDQILQKRKRNSQGKAVYTHNQDGEVVLGSPKKGVPLSDTWAIPFLNPKAKERTGYPTQKPISLLERIILLASKPEMCVLDPFCGSGTSLVAAALNDRDYLGIDISPDAIALAKNRLEKPTRSNSLVLETGYEAYDNLESFVKNILDTLPVRQVQRNSGVDALHNVFWEDYPVPIRVQRQDESLEMAAEKLAKAGQKMQARRMILIQTHSTQQNTFISLIPKEMIIISTVAKQLENVFANLEEF